MHRRAIAFHLMPCFNTTPLRVCAFYLHEASHEQGTASFPALATPKTRADAQRHVVWHTACSFRCAVHAAHAACRVLSLPTLARILSHRQPGGTILPPPDAVVYEI
ncbi:NADH:flavin oxidoreductase [Anopheles sinensis]|uniref:NADH:flavin oxidoreductase n=1 Tax=Anopheles sinensis TaxID=74873 RepID=A0A084WP22_ANOSI|nr:NADH:flavin oxidoreductase [Anopheles sinensis]